MPRNATGTCTLAEPDFVPNTTIVSADMNSDLNDIADMLTDSLSRSGKGGMSADLDMNTHKVTELTAGTAATDAVNFGQLSPLYAAGVWAIAGGTANAITATYTSTVALTDGQICYVRATAANTSTTPTFSPNALTARTIVKNGNLPLIAGDIAANAELILRYNLSGTRWELLNPTIDLQTLGALAGAPVGKTANYTILNADKGTTFYLSGGTCFTMTLGAASGFDQDFQCRITNQDSRGKIMAFNGLTSFFLWPGQSVTVMNQNNVWWCDPFIQRWHQTTGATFHVNVSAGSNANDGLSNAAGGPLATIQEAVSRINQYGDGQFIISLADGTYSVGAGIIVILTPPQNSNQIQITGNAGTPSSVVITCDAGGNCLNVQDGAIVTLTGAYLQTTGNGSTGAFSRQKAVVDLINVDFAGFPLGSHMLCTTWSSLNVLGDYNIFGDASVHINCQNNAYINYGSFTVTISTARAFTTFLSTQTSATVNNGGVAMTFAGAGVAGTTGTEYAVQYNSVALIGTTLPGDVAGATGTGGQFA